MERHAAEVRAEAGDIRAEEARTDADMAAQHAASVQVELATAVDMERALDASRAESRRLRSRGHAVLYVEWTETMIASFYLVLRVCVAVYIVLRAYCHLRSM